jgi:hypothetical protein
MIAGLLIGIVIGLLIGPVVRSWLTWQQYRSADREARLTDDILRRMEEEPAPGHRPDVLHSAR